jgi:group II intron reverse transcriptase/maturase
MQNAETTLSVYEDRGKRGLHLERVYRQLFNKELWLQAYSRLAQNAGAMTKGATQETVDGMSERKIEDLIQLLRQEKYEWTPVRRILIPKTNGKMRPLGIPTWSDKLLQEVMRSILEAYFEPQFSLNSHGFRPNRGCHSALKDIEIAWTGTKWFIEGDIKGCFDNIDHTTLMSTLRDKIHDERFLKLVENLLKAGYLERWEYHRTLSGTPQGGIISPLLANIYMDRLDGFVEKTLVPEYTKGEIRKRTREYQRCSCRIRRLRKSGTDPERVKALLKERKTIPSNDQMDPDYRRLRYIRYADDFLLGFQGPRDEAEVIKRRIGDFLRDNLKLEMSAEKTKITHAATEKACFLGYEVGVQSRKNIELRLPLQKLEGKIAKYAKDGKPVHRPEMIDASDFDIINTYGSEYRGIVQYYAYARNRSWLSRLSWYMVTSMLKTLAAKHKSTVAVMARKFRSIRLDNNKWMRCFMATVERPGREPLYARFGGISLQRQPLSIIEDTPIDLDRKGYRRSELLARLLARTCEICGSTEKIEVHHVRKLADLKVKGQKDAPAWKQSMASRKRKTLVLCNKCHTTIHAGNNPTRNRTTTNVF